VSFPDLPDGYYLAELTTWRPKIFRRTTLDGESHWRGERDDRMPDPRTFGYALTPLSDITALAAMTARAEKAEALHAMESAWAAKAEVIVDAAIALRQVHRAWFSDPTFYTKASYEGAQLILDAAILAGEPTEGDTL